MLPTKGFLLPEGRARERARQHVPGLEGAEPAGIYVHVPFCSAVCPYCDFAVTKSRREQHQPYVARLLEEIDAWSPSAASFDTVYFGGGTPSALSSELLATVLKRLAARFHLRQPRVSLEVNPEDVDDENARAWRALGVHTVSLGLQALDDAALRFLGRRHRRAQALRAVETVQCAGFDVVALDLIYGLPEQTVERWLATLEEAVALAPGHLSCYELTVHEGTPFARWQARGGLRLPGDIRRAELFEATHRFLGERGFDGYEVSNFARERESRSRHNQKYWCHVPYLGLGPSAHSFDGARRWWNRRSLQSYLEPSADGRAVAEVEALGSQELELETLLFGMRTADGLDLKRFAQRFGAERRCALEERARGPVQQGLLVRTDHRLHPTLRGMAIADSLTLQLGDAAVGRSS